MENKHSAPIFIHSLFRAGSTYLFNVFRQSESNYWCYQEPLHEKLLLKASQPNGFSKSVSGIQQVLRHPELDKPYTYEFQVVANEVARLFKQEFAYDQYFINEKDELKDIKDYFTALINGAKGRPVLQCCRTTGRVAGLRSACGGIHLLLWRNPWDQWWSYKSDSYFNSRNLFITDAKNLPAFLDSLKNELKIPAFNNTPPSVKHAYFTNRQLDSNTSYTLFYALWCHAMLEAKSKCDLVISIDQLSISSTNQQKTIDKLQQLGVTGINFTDCSIPRASYGESDEAFFTNAENHVHKLLLTHGYSSEQINELIQLAEERRELVTDTSIPENYAVRDAMRAREYLLRAENRLSEMQNTLFSVRAQAQHAEAKARELEARLGQY